MVLRMRLRRSVAWCIDSRRCWVVSLGYVLVTWVRLVLSFKTVCVYCVRCRGANWLCRYAGVYEYSLDFVPAITFCRAWDEEVWCFVSTGFGTHQFQWCFVIVWEALWKYTISHSAFLYRTELKYLKVKLTFFVLFDLDSTIQSELWRSMLLCPLMSVSDFHNSN